MSINKVTLIGNLGQDPELKATKNNKDKTTLSIATNEVWKDSNGEKQERVQWHRVVVYGSQAKHCVEYLSKGRSVYIEGRLNYLQWEDEEGQKHKLTEIVASTVQFLGTVPKGQTNNPPTFNDEDIPF